MKGEDRHPPFELPAEPIDQHELIWWNVREGDVERSRAVYHVNTPWEVAVPNDKGNHPGVALVDDWQMFDGRDRFHGRNCGWNPWHQFDWRGSFTTEAEAREEALVCVVGYIGRAERELERYKELKAKHLAALGRTL